MKERRGRIIFASVRFFHLIVAVYVDVINLRFAQPLSVTDTLVELGSVAASITVTQQGRTKHSHGDDYTVYHSTWLKRRVCASHQEASHRMRPGEAREA